MNSQENLPIDQGITEISVQGFKSLYEESRIEIRALTRYIDFDGLENLLSFLLNYLELHSTHSSS